jgi:hypothetical protein
MAENSIVAASRVVVIVMRAVLKPSWHRTGWIASAVADIEVNAVPATGHGTPIAILTSPRGLILGRYHAIGIAAAPDIEIVAVSAVLNLAQPVVLARSD